MFEFYMSGPDTVKHGGYRVYYKGGCGFGLNLEKANDMVLKYHIYSKRVVIPDIVEKSRTNLTTIIGKMVST